MAGPIAFYQPGYPVPTIPPKPNFDRLPAALRINSVKQVMVPQMLRRTTKFDKARFPISMTNRKEYKAENTDLSFVRIFGNAGSKCFQLVGSASLAVPTVMLARRTIGAESTYSVDLKFLRSSSSPPPGPSCYVIAIFMIVSPISHESEQYRLRKPSTPSSCTRRRLRRTSQEEVLEICTTTQGDPRKRRAQKAAPGAFRVSHEAQPRVVAARPPQLTNLFIEEIWAR